MNDFKNSFSLIFSKQQQEKLFDLQDKFAKLMDKFDSTMSEVIQRKEFDLLSSFRLILTQISAELKTTQEKYNQLVDEQSRDSQIHYIQKNLVFFRE